MLKRFLNRRSAAGYSPVAEAEQTLLDHELELTDATRMDANLARLMATDSDAARIFERGDFTRCLDDMDRYGQQHGDRIKAFAAAKHAAGRMDLYYSLFDLTD